MFVDTLSIVFKISASWILGLGEKRRKGTDVSSVTQATATVRNEGCASARPAAESAYKIGRDGKTKSQRPSPVDKRFD